MLAIERELAIGDAVAEAAYDCAEEGVAVGYVLFKRLEAEGDVGSLAMLVRGEDGDDAGAEVGELHRERGALKGEEYGVAAGLVGAFRKGAEVLAGHGGRAVSRGADLRGAHRGSGYGLGRVGVNGLRVVAVGVDDVGMKIRVWAALLMLVGLTVAGRAKPKTPDHWVGTWATAVYGDANKSPLGTSDVTLRQVVHVSLGGPLVRVEFSNEFGLEPLVIGAAHVALSDGGSAVSLGSAHALTFGGLGAITIPPGATAMSDSAAMAVPALGNLTVSVFLPAQKISRLSWHWAAHATGYQAAGNVVGQASLDGAAGFQKNTNFFFLKGVDVKTAPETGAIAAFGDSITDGTNSTLDANARWPDVLARRLQKEKKYKGLGVLNEGIGGIGWCMTGRGLLRWRASTRMC